MVAIRVWNKCNNNCIMCSNYFVRNIDEGERTFSSMLSRVKEKEPEPKEITFTGGEPFLNPGIFDLIDRFRNLYPKTRINILSNGRLFYYPKYCAKLKKHFDSNMQLAVSICGHSSKVHDSVTLTKNSFVQTAKGIKNLLKQGIPIELRVIVLQQNVKHLEAIANYVSKNFKGINYVVFIFVDLVSNAVKNKKLVAVKYTKTIPYLAKSLNVLKKNNVDFRLYHFPLCILPAEYWKNSWVSVERSKIKPTAKCKKCTCSKECVGILKGYYNIFGDAEFKAKKV